MNKFLLSSFIFLMCLSVHSQTPKVNSAIPSDGATGVALNANLSANDLFLPNFDTSGNSGVDNSSITNSSVLLFKIGSSVPLSAGVNGTGGGDAINLDPSLPLEPNTRYRFVVDGVLDNTGVPFDYFESNFTTGSGGSSNTSGLDNVSFLNMGPVASGFRFTSLQIGPDSKLYGLQFNGDIHRWDMEADGTLSNNEVLSRWKNASQGNYGSNRLTVGFVFDPSATADNLIAYISHNSAGLSGAPAWDGNISRLSGADLGEHDLIITGLPRSKKDHLTNSLAFKPGEPDVIYFNQGSNTAGGAPDNAWGNRKERLLSGATLRLDLNILPESQWPLNVKTTMDLQAINNVNVDSPTLVSTVDTYEEDGQTFPDDGTYNPYYVNAPVTLYASGVRNAYDLVWHSNGQLYIPANGTAGGSNSPASIDGTRRPDGSIYDHNNLLYPVIPESNGNNVQRDWLFRVDPNSSLGYFGHPNPLRGEFVLNRGDADVDGSPYNGVQADANYRGDAFDFEYNISPNGVIEYKSGAEFGNLTGALLVARYSGGSDIIVLVPDGPNGDILTSKIGIPGFSGFTDPLDLVENVTNGNIYVADYGTSELILLKPGNQSTPAPFVVLNTDNVIGNALSNGNGLSYTEEIIISNLGNAVLSDITFELTGADAGLFTVLGAPSTINTQSSSSFKVSFMPTSNGPKEALLTISGTDADSVTLPLRGLGVAGYGGDNEPSLQWVLGTQLGADIIDVGDTDATTSQLDLGNGSSYNDLLGDEISAQRFIRSQDGPVVLELLSVYGPASGNTVLSGGWYQSGDAASVNEILTVSNQPTTNAQSLNVPINGSTEFDPGINEFGFYSSWPALNDRQVFSEDQFNTFDASVSHKVRVYALPGEADAYVIAMEEFTSDYDYNDVVFIARNIQPYEGPTLADISLEAECAVIGTGWSLVSDANVSGGEYLMATSGANFYSSAPTDTESLISFDFTAVAAGTYSMYALINTPNMTSDSFWVRANGGAWVKWNDLLREGFEWRRLYDSDANANLVSLELFEGANTLDIAIREDGASIDKIYLTNAGNIPNDLGPEATNCVAPALTADAGADVTVVLPESTAVLSGSAVDPNEGVLVYEWTQVDGPDTGVLTNSDTAELTASSLVAGDYVFSLAVTDESNNTVSDEATVSVVTAPSQIWLEAECAVIGSGWSAISDANVSEGQYVSATSGNNFYSSAPTDAGSWISFEFTASAGSYDMYALINTPAAENDSFWVRANGGAWVKWNGLLRQGGFEWRQLYDSDANANLVSFELTEGANTLDIAIREDGASIDKIYLSDSGTAPTGLGQEATNCVAPALTADAGADVTVVLPESTAVLSGSAVDPNEGVLVYEWTQVDGPDTGVLTNSDTAELTASSLVAGDYVFSLAVTDESNNTVSDEATVSVVTAPSQIWLEAECAVIGSGWSAISDANVSEGQYVSATSGNNFYSSAPTDAGSWISFEFTASAGSYDMYALINTPAAENDSFWVRANGGAWVKWNGLLRQGGFEWRQLYDSDANANLVSFELTEGANTLDIAIREDGASIDKIYLSDSGTAPTGLGQEATNCVAPALTADAGADVTVVLPESTAVLSGSAVDPNEGVLVYEWTQVDGPDTGVLTNSDTAELTASSLVAGDYVFSLAVTDESNNTVSDEATVSVVTAPSQIWLEAECAVIGSGWSAISDANVSEGQYVSATSGNNFYSSAPTDTGSWISFEFTASAGSYDMYALINTPNTTTDSFWVRANGGTWIKWNELVGAGGFEWRQLYDSDAGAAPVSLDLSEGANTLDVAIREDGASIDKIYLGDSGIAPTGLGGASTNCGPVDAPPLADAGEDVTIVLPVESTVLNGGGSDPDGGEVTYQWGQTSGPNTATLINADTANPTVDGLIAGDYEFSLTVTNDTGVSVTDRMGLAVLVSGDIWLEAECGTAGTEWTVVDDPNVSGGGYARASNTEDYFFAAPTDPSSIVSIDFDAKAGTYDMYARMNTPTSDNDSFWVRANGGAWIKWNNLIANRSGFIWTRLYDSDAGEAVVTLNLLEGSNTIDFAARESGAQLDKVYLTSTGGVPSGLGNTATNCGLVDLSPSADAGNDIGLTLPTDSVTISGIGNDPDGGSVVYSWSQSSGPSVALLTGSDGSSLIVENLVEGVYNFRFEVTDDEGNTASDTVFIIVSAPPMNVSPFVNAGEDVSVASPVTSVILSGSGSDPDGGTVSYSWSQTSGPMGISLSGSDTSDLTVDGLVEGNTYTFRVDVTDDEGETSFDEVGISVGTGTATGDILPFVYAGTDLIFDPSITTVVIDGKGNDPDGGAVSFQWVQLEGPTLAISGVSDVADLTVDTLTEGEYLFRLSVTDDEGNTVSDDVNVSLQLTGDVWLEAECATVGFFWSEVEDASASNGGFVHVPDEENFQVAPANGYSHVSFDFMAEAGSYSLYGLVNAPDNLSDSFWVRINNGEWINWNGFEDATGFAWKQVYDSNSNGAFVTLDLESGSNRIEFANREAGVSLDKIYLTRSGGIPTGFGGRDFTCTAPKIMTYFNGVSELSKSYRGPVMVVIEAFENGNSGAVNRLDYVLDNTAITNYTAPFTVSSEGVHTLVVTAENTNGNVSRISYEFIIETYDRGSTQNGEHDQGTGHRQGIPGR